MWGIDGPKCNGTGQSPVVSLLTLQDVIYNVGDVIAFRTKGSKEKVTWQITEITDSTIVSGGQSIAPYKIGAMYVDQKSIDLFPLPLQVCAHSHRRWCWLFSYRFDQLEGNRPVYDHCFHNDGRRRTACNIFN
ncbi:MAG: hypothetical protein WDO15_06030 [Bacteroidota bacterium]